MNSEKNKDLKPIFRIFKFAFVYACLILLLDWVMHSYMGMDKQTSNVIYKGLLEAGAWAIVLALFVNEIRVMLPVFKEEEKVMRIYMWVRFVAMMVLLALITYFNLKHNDLSPFIELIRNKISG